MATVPPPSVCASPHPTSPTGPFLSPSLARASVLPHGTYIQVSLVDLVDDLQVSGEQLLHQVHWPALQGFGEHRVVGVGEGLLGDVPGLMVVGESQH